MADKLDPVTLDDLENAFTVGYSNASASFRALSKERIGFNNFHRGVYKLDADCHLDHELYTGMSGDVLVTTEVFGDVSGKSYLFISEREYAILTERVPDGVDRNVDLKLEFLKELDNILSASVITALSNELRISVYGDIPQLVSNTTIPLPDLIFSDFKDYADEVYVTTIFFSFEGQPSLRPLFVWVINTTSLKGLERSTGQELFL